MALELFLNINEIEAGCDEAGRGCLAGPVTAAAVILDPKNPIIGLDDSKKLTEKKRDILRIEIEEKALAWAVSHVSPSEIDKINILNASFLAMHRAILQLETKPTSLLIDGNRFKKFDKIPHHCIIKGDGKYMSIAAASILAKTHRDEIMQKLDVQHPQFKWAQNKGYPTAHHKGLLQKLDDITTHHRKSFSPIKQIVAGVEKQEKLDL